MAPSDPLALQPLGQRPADRLRERLAGQRRQCAGEAVGLRVLQAKGMPSTTILESEGLYRSTARV